MAGTAAGVAFGAASGGAIGGLLAGADYGVALGAVIGASVSVIASKENNLRKLLHFFLAFCAGLIIAFPASDMIADIWAVKVSPRFVAIIAAAMVIPILLLLSSAENIEKTAKWISGFISRRFGGG